MFGFLQKQKQKQNGTGLAVQAGQNAIVNINNGPTVEEVRAMALDVFRANLMELRGLAQTVANERGEAITEKFIEKLQHEYPDGLQQAQTPDFQDALFTVQKEFAKAGDEDLGDLLVDLLIDRTKQDSRTILQIVLNESLHTAPKLTAEQIATISVVFFFRKVRSTAVNSIQELASYYQKHIGSIVGQVSVTPATFGHLEYTGCGTVSLGSISLEDILIRTYPGLFKSGFDQARLDQAQISESGQQQLIIMCLNDSTRFQIAALNEDVLNQKMTGANLQEDEKTRINALFNEANLPHDQIRQKLLSVAPFLQALTDQWSASSLSHFELTSVGMAIGHANIKKDVGEFAPLSIWIT